MIDAALVGRDSFRGIARRFAVSADAVERHAKAHLPAALAHAQDAAEMVRGDDLLAQVRELQARALAILDRAERGEDLRSALGAIREARGNLELLGKLAGQLQVGATVNILLSPEWMRVRVAVVEALAPFPNARLAVAEVIGSIDAGA